MNGAVPLDVGDKVMCLNGDAECILAPTHTYKISAWKRDEKHHMHVQVANSQGELMPGWFPVVPHFL